MILLNVLSCQTIEIGETKISLITVADLTLLEGWELYTYSYLQYCK